MKAPICKICQRSDILCAGCQAKLDNGEISLHDVEVARALAKLSDRYSAIEKTEFKKAFGIGNLTIIMVPKGMAGQMIGRRGIFIKELSKMLNKKIKIVEETPDNKELIQKVLFPAKLIGVNIVYGPNKTESYKVRVPKEDRNRVFDKELLEKFFSELLKGETSIIFE